MRTLFFNPMRATAVSAVLLVLGVGTAYAQTAPTVSNVTAAQRGDESRLVDIRYDLAHNAACTVWAILSGDAGQTWTLPITSLTGDIGAGVTPGLSRHIVWDSKVDLPGAFGTQYKVQVCAVPAIGPGSMVLIPAGEFLMGDSFNEGYTDERPVHAVYVGAFYMDRHEVTNQQYADALNWSKAQGNLISVTSGVVYKYNSGTTYPYCDTTNSSSYSRITWNGNTFGVVAGKENHPMVRVSWYGSAAYANWRSAIDARIPSYDTSTWACNFDANGYRLPTEGEWEKAARGGAAGHRFPWSDTDTIQHARANYYSSSDYSYDTSPTRGFHPTFNTGVYPYTSPAGYFAPNGYGLYDMAGNVWEWCNDWYGSSFYSISPYDNPRGPTSGSSRVLRGGSWGNNADNLRCANRSYSYPDSRGGNIGVVGFRLALDSY